MKNQCFGVFLLIPDNLDLIHCLLLDLTITPTVLLHQLKLYNARLVVVIIIKQQSPSVPRIPVRSH